MIQSIKLKQPLGLKTTIINSFKNIKSNDNTLNNWIQRDIMSLYTGESFKNKLVKVVNKHYNWNTKPQQWSCIAHRVEGSIEEHEDNESKTVFLFPIKTSSKTKIVVEHKELLLKDKQCIRFNDYNRHYLESTENSISIFVTLSFDSL